MSAPAPFAIPTPSNAPTAVLPLVASKSESNRALILRALAGPGLRLRNLSAARDTRLLEALLASGEDTLDARDAGTTLRFLTAWCCAAGRPALLTGTPRMQQRPIGLLVDALRQLGADIRYEGAEGYPPHRVRSFSQKQAECSIRGDVSSQFISALLLIGPFLPLGLRLSLTGDITSRPYIDMTLQWMARFGLRVEESDHHFLVPPQPPVHGEYTIESDWSAAGYWYSLLALRRRGQLTLLHLRDDSLQGDRRLADLFTRLGVRSEFTPAGVRITPGPCAPSFEADFSDIPDQAQTFAACCAGLGIPARLTGLKSLRIKETDRIAALQAELARLGCHAPNVGDEELLLPGTPLHIQGQTLHTYDDHRMAMAFAPLSALGPLSLDDPHVVAKSYPSFWDDWNLTRIS